MRTSRRRRRAAAAAAASDGPPALPAAPTGSAAPAAPAASVAAAVGAVALVAALLTVAPILPAAPASAATVTVSTAADLITAADAAADGDVIVVAADLQGPDAVTAPLVFGTTADPGSDITLDLGGHTVEVHPAPASGAGGVVGPADATLRIMGGTLEALADDGAGIAVPLGSTLELDSVIVDATGVGGAAGIGGDRTERSMGTVLIDGGSQVTAFGGGVADAEPAGGTGAGIGGAGGDGFSHGIPGGDGGELTVTGGSVVRATGGSVAPARQDMLQGAGAGIGGGGNGGDCSAVSIHTAAVTATGGRAAAGGAGIGGGGGAPGVLGGCGGSVDIVDGVVTATGGDQVGGEAGDLPDPLGGSSGAGIGGGGATSGSGAAGDAAYLTISGASSEVNALGGTSISGGAGAGIGGGGGADAAAGLEAALPGFGGLLAIDGGTVTATGGQALGALDLAAPGGGGTGGGAGVGGGGGAGVVDGGAGPAVQLACEDGVGCGTVVGVGGAGTDPAGTAVLGGAALGGGGGGGGIDPGSGLVGVGGLAGVVDVEGGLLRVTGTPATPAIGAGYPHDDAGEGDLGQLDVGAAGTLELTPGTELVVPSGQSLRNDGLLLNGTAASGAALTGGGTVANGGTIRHGSVTVAVTGNNYLVDFGALTAAIRVYAPSFAAAELLLPVPAATSATLFTGWRAVNALRGDTPLAAEAVGGTVTASAQRSALALTGDAVLGGTLGVTITPTTTAAYQWARAGAPISGATSAEYVPVTADLGSVLTAEVTAPTPPGYAGPASGSVASDPVLAGTLTISVPSAVDLGAWAPGATAEQTLSSIVVDDQRAGSATWTTAFTITAPASTSLGASIPVANFSIESLAPTTTGTVTAVPGSGSGGSGVLMQATARSGANTADWDAILRLAIPPSALAASDYRGTLTVSVY